MTTIRAPRVFLDSSDQPLLSTHATRKNFQIAVWRNFKDPAIKKRLMNAHDAVEEDFGELKKDGEPKKRRTGEPLYLHSVGVGYMLMQEFGETDPDLIFEALHHDYGEDIDWENVTLPKPEREFFKRLAKYPNLAHIATHPLSSAERLLLRRQLQKREGFTRKNAQVVSALTIDKVMTVALPETNLYYDQIKELRDQRLIDRASKIRIADKIYNLRSGEMDLADPDQWARLAKQTQAAIDFTLPICGLVNTEDRKKYTDKLMEAILYSIMRLEAVEQRLLSKVEAKTQPGVQSFINTTKRQLTESLDKSLAALQKTAPGLILDTQQVIDSTRKRVMDIWGGLEA